MQTAVATADADFTAHRIPTGRQAIYRFYRLAFDADGCPMKRMDDGSLTFHPLLGAYLICDYILEYGVTRDPDLIARAEAVARHALRHAEPHGDSLIYWYRPESKLSAVPYTFYSALTQAWYVKAFARLSDHSDALPYTEIVHQFFNSLLIPAEEGGVLVRKRYGWILEEYPVNPPLYTLNGWLTALYMILNIREELNRHQVPYHELLSKSLDAAEHLLPRYDASFVANSRYQLTGYTRLRMVFDRPAEANVEDFSITIPDEGEYAGNLTATTGYRWENYLERQEEKLLQFNIVLSLVSYPKKNRFRCRLHINAACSVKIFVADGDYRPDTSGMPTQRWRQISNVKLKEGENEIALGIPFDRTNMFAYPTNFKKRIDGVYYNSYHILHIIDLAQIYSYVPRPALRTMARRWLSYMDEWPNIPALQQPGYSLKSHSYGDTLNDFVKGKLKLPASTMPL